MSNTIKLKGCGRYEEAVANAALTPGHLIEVMSTGKVRKHATEGVTCVKRFAVEDALQGKTIDDAYAADDVVGFIIPEPGDQVNALLTPGDNYAKGDKLYSKGDGTLTKTSAVSGKVALAEVDQAIDLSGGGAVATHAAVVIL